MRASSTTGLGSAPSSPLDQGAQAADMRRTARHDDAMFGKVSAQRVDRLGPLPDEQVSRPERHCRRLLGLGLRRHEPHRRAGRRLRNGLGI